MKSNTPGLTDLTFDIEQNQPKNQNKNLRLYKPNVIFSLSWQQDECNFIQPLKI